MSEFHMPSLGADMESGTLVEWKIKPGDTVKKGDIMAVVETAKGVVEIEIFDAGVVAEIYLPTWRRKCRLGQVLAMVLSARRRWPPRLLPLLKPLSLPAAPAAAAPAPAVPAPAVPEPAPAPTRCRSRRACPCLTAGAQDCCRT